MFRQDQIAFTCNVAKMFLQFRVPELHSNLLRFYWFKDSNPDSQVAVYYMFIHLFAQRSTLGVSVDVLRTIKMLT